MPQQESPESAEQPLQGVVLCFTSIGPEDRTRYADIAIKMGAEHKLDLTSDTSHLIVGSTDTLKYQYVAREREDIKVLLPEWIEAVREQWINDLPSDLDALAVKYRVPTLAGLKICITGFEDLVFRAQLQKNVKENGGEYTGDLTKDVTHLIAAKPEGKKYEYGMQWQKKVVSLKWYKDSLERGMQLDETLYHPTLPVTEQGVGAWNRKQRPSPQLGKRAREETIGAEPSRKLRRTASVRLGSQNQGMWSDIVGGAGFEATTDGRPRLKPSISMPSLRRLDGPATPAETVRNDQSDARSDPGNTRSEGFLAGCHFMVQCLDQKKNAHLRRILTSLAATIIDEDETQSIVEPNKLFVILPHNVAAAGAFPVGTIPDGFQVVSELWLEKCMIAKSFIAPESYPLGQVIREPRTSLKGLTINVSGFDGIENVHIIKIVTLLGGTYVEAFTSAISVLICRAAFARRDKLELAHHWGIPVVTEEWLWSTMKDHAKASIKDHLLQPQRMNTDTTIVTKAPTTDHEQLGTIFLQRKASDGSARRQGRPQAADKPTRTGAVTVTPTRSSTPVIVHQESADVADVPDVADVANVANVADVGDVAGVADGREMKVFSGRTSASGRSDTQDGSYIGGKCPLRELPPTSARRNGQAIEHTKAPIRSLDDASSVEEQKAKEETQGAVEVAAKLIDVCAINGAIRDMLRGRSNQKAANEKANDEPRKKPNRLVGRALSNLSNASSASNVRHSRASSVGSVNTDGIGSELPTKQLGENQEGESTSAAEKRSFSLNGRAKTPLAGLNSAAYGMGDPDLVGPAGFHAEQESAPRMTQLGYEDPEEAILLREKLAASRRKRSKNHGDSEAENQDEEAKPPVTKRKTADRKIRDDDLLAIANTGWGSRTRTRHKQRSPPGIKGF
ncbi:hypothetical protein A1O7_08610 [Cladophialophora yegresii CBS 114405]|uniref:BRCT domain-containing protein n=1 Tax=Cladophialophora yegresii CBS 114405 TaxID=1182544 RepID=W9VU32_9EURO|nr:uncharacterized protein A1O7_08610 [Cladophialophora yegresii CBS 114405]EXJ55681.1 hypothetical protein A1O7_08610 [Cladophialophora yegresii CBS 114405]